jgi:hypothetical protein
MGHQQAIEWIGMQQRQLGSFDQMLIQYRQERSACCEALSATGGRGCGR